MSRQKFIVGAILLIVASASIAIGLHARSSSRADSAVHSPVARCVEVARISPPGGPSEEVECESLGFVEFKYRIVNCGKVPISGLKIGTKCACETVREPPSEILPGESATVAYRLRAPRAGSMQRKIPLTTDDATEPLAMLDVNLSVKFDPPALTLPQRGLSITFIKGDLSPRELMLEAIEAKKEERWIRGLELDVGDDIEVRPSDVEELPE